ncbi:MAG: DUF1836 domain-containing protein [Lachnospiraceae bacterium]|nr:DUF1836 domain-containing protein [Lachnospiraceae bacterium]
MPRYNELPNVGLYLEQVTKYINGFIVPLGCAELTTSMVSNYVKKGVIAPPVKKQYYAEQIGYLLFIGIAKSILSMENIAQLFEMQKAVYTTEVAYNYLCSEFENMLRFVVGKKDSLNNIETVKVEAKTETKMMLRSVLIAAAHTIYLNNCFDIRKQRLTSEK